MKPLPTFLLPPGLACYLFIYLVQDDEADCSRYCTVLAYGRNLEAAERVAADRVERAALKILRVDTATAAPWLDPARDGEYLADLARFGSALRLSETEGCRDRASAA